MSDEAAALEALLARQPAADFTAELRDEQVAEFRACGFTSIARLTSDEELGWLGELYDWLFAERVQPVPGGYFDLSRAYESDGPDLQPQILSPETRFPALRRTAVFRNGRRLAARLLGGDEAGLRGWGHMIRKPAGIGAPLPWHQDEAYWDPAFEYEALGVWMTLDPATRESGCMSFIPGSHRGEVRKHRHVGDDPAVHALITDEVDAQLAIAVPVRPGGAIFHHCRVLHSSGANTSARVRRAWANEFQRAPQPRAQPVERPWIDAGKRAWESRRPRPT
ncbi:MAG: phytanoyl-CoA dioxygenase family protein [bacterium]